MTLKNMWIAGRIAFAILMSGCAPAQPAFNAGNKGVVFVDGKPYAVPYGSKYSLHTLGNISALWAMQLQQAGVGSCTNDSITWAGPSADERLEAIIKDWKDGKITQDDLRRKTSEIITEEYVYGNFDCTNPLSEQEYSYWMNKSNQAAANARAAAYSAPKQIDVNYNGNINHTGTMFHYNF